MAFQKNQHSGISTGKALEVSDSNNNQVITANEGDTIGGTASDASRYKYWYGNEYWIFRP